MKQFLNSNFYVTPCGAVPKGDDPHGRIIHDYSYAPQDTDSLKSCLQNTSVTYISFIERARQLAPFNWYFAVDLENGYRQLPVHPSDWHTQIYSLGPEEFYIDIYMLWQKISICGFVSREVIFEINIRSLESFGCNIVEYCKYTIFLVVPLKR